MEPDLFRRDFPVLNKTWPNGNLIYLDNACSSLKPRAVNAAVADYYENYPVCGERSVHRLGRVVTQRVDEARERVAGFFHARRPEEVVWTKNATEAINLVAHGLDWKAGDVVVTTDKEHNSNWVPWLHLRATRGIRLIAVPSKEDGQFDLDAYAAALDEADDRLRLVSVVHGSNADGHVNPLARMARLAHDRGALVLADAAQSAPHHPIDMGELGVDFLAVSLHKMLAPSGVGCLIGKTESFGKLGPFLLGGGTVKTSSPDGYEWQSLPYRYEAGLQNFAGLFAIPAALEYLGRVGLGRIEAHERRLNQAATDALETIPGVKIHGPPARLRSGIVPFTVDPFDAQDVATYLDEKRNIAVRGGSFCVNAYVGSRSPKGWARASFYLYNTLEEVDEFAGTVEGLARSVRARRGKVAAPSAR